MASLQGYNVEPGHFVAKPQRVSDINVFSQVSQFLSGGILLSESYNPAC